MKILLVGAGAVGQVFAHHLHEAGASVAFRIRRAHADAAREGFVLYRRRRSGPGPPLALRDVELRVEGEADGDTQWDQVWLCTSSQDLRRPWLDALADSVGDATVVAIQPDLDDRAHLLARFGEERLVQGLIGFLSYQAPLPGEQLPRPGVAYWLPPGVATGFHGVPERVRPIVNALRRSEFSARVRRGLPDASALRSATTVPLVAGLELAGWSLPGLVSGPVLPEAVAASRQALAVVDAMRGTRSAARRLLLRAGPAGAALRLAPHGVPFDLAAYLQFHFTKTAAQTRLLLDTWIARGAEKGVATDRIVALRAALS